MRKKSLKSVRLSSNMPALPCWHLLASSQAKPLNSVRHYSVTRSLALMCINSKKLTGFGFAAFIVGLLSIIEGLGVQKVWANRKVRTDVVNGDLGFDLISLKPDDEDKFA